MNRYIRIVFILSLLTLALAAPAFAAEAAEKASPWAAFWVQLAEVAGKAVGALLLPLILWVSSWLRTKWKLETDFLKEDRARSLAADVARWVEEWAARQFANGVAVSSEQKLDKGATKLMVKIGSSKETAARIIESVLPQLALGATKVLGAVEKKLDEKLAEPPKAAQPAS